MPLPINYLTSAKNNSSHWYNCFVDEKNFEKFWYCFWKYESYIRGASGIISTDFSIYRDMPEKKQIRNCYRNRVMAYAMQKINPNVIPTAGFGNERTWDWCFDGLPNNSTIAVTTNGVLTDPEARRLFAGGIDALISSLCPYALVICGNYPAWLNTKYPEIKIVPILNFSQMRRQGRI